MQRKSETINNIESDDKVGNSVEGRFVRKKGEWNYEKLYEDYDGNLFCKESGCFQPRKRRGCACRNA